MATTAYERYLKNKKEEDALEAVDVQVQDPKPIDLDQIKLRIQNELTQQTEPKKPVKWLSLPDPKNIMNLYYTLNPTKRLSDAIGMKKDPKELIKQMPDQEKDYISGLDEIARGIDSGIYDLQHSLGSLLFAGTDLLANTDFMSGFEKIMEKEGNLVNRPETWRGEVTSLLTQFGVPGTLGAKIIGRIPGIVKMKRAADAVKGGKLRKTSQVATRATEGATIVGVTDFIASEPGRESIFFEPESTDGLTGRKKAAAEFRNRIKYGAEGSLVGGGFPLVGKFTQLGYKYGLAPVVKTSASLGAKTIDKAVFRPAEIILGSKIAKPLTTRASKGIQNATNFTVSRLMAPLLVSGMSRKVVTQLPPFEQWRLKSVTDPNPVNKSIKKLDNFLSFFRSYGKQPKDIEGVSEQVQLL